MIVLSRYCAYRALIVIFHIYRHMIVVSGEKKGLTAKHVTPLATISTRVEGSVLFLSAPGQETISVNWKEAAKSGHVERFMSVKLNTYNYHCLTLAWFDAKRYEAPISKL